MALRAIKITITKQDYEERCASRDSNTSAKGAKNDPLVTFGAIEGGSCGMPEGPGERTHARGAVREFTSFERALA